LGDKDAASNAIAHIGTNSLPFLLQWIQHEPTQWRGKLRGLLARLPYNWSLRMSDRIAHPRSERLAFGTYEAFGILGPRATPALPDLCRFMDATNAPETSVRATAILRFLGTNALPALLAVMQDPRHPRRRQAVASLGSMRDIGDAAKLSVPAIIACTRETNDENLAFWATRALGSLKAVPELSVPALVSCLQRTNARLHVEAADALAAFGPQAIGAIPALTNAVADSNQDVWDSVMTALHKIAPDTFTNVPPPPPRPFD
jgi:hypothetical protein